MIEKISELKIKMVISRLTYNISFILAAFILALIVILSFGAPWVTEAFLQTNPNSQNLQNNFAPWFSEGHLLGTDELGRDVLTRLLFAGRISLTIAFSVAILQSILGTLLGLLAGYFGGWLDDTINASLQIVRSIPTFFLLIVLSALTRPSVMNLVLILSLLGWPHICRQVRGLVFAIKAREFIEAARASGVSEVRILFSHIFPNTISIVLVIASLDISSAIIVETSLSFLGFGVQPPTPSWGNMLSNALSGISSAPWLVVTPGIFITITVFCVFIITDSLRDAFDPQSSIKGQRTVP